MSSSKNNARLTHAINAAHFNMDPEIKKAITSLAYHSAGKSDMAAMPYSEAARLVMPLAKLGNEEGWDVNSPLMLLDAASKKVNGTKAKATKKAPAKKKTATKKAPAKVKGTTSRVQAKVKSYTNPVEEATKAANAPIMGSPDMMAAIKAMQTLMMQQAEQNAAMMQTIMAKLSK